MNAIRAVPLDNLWVSLEPLRLDHVDGLVAAEGGLDAVVKTMVDHASGRSPTKE